MSRAPIATMLVAFTLAVCAQDAAGVDTTGAPILDFPLSARVRAMGDNGVADNTDPANIFFNPANVVGPGRFYVQGARWQVEKGLVDDAWIGGLSTGIRRKRGAGLSWGADLTYARLEFGEMEVVPDYTTPIGPAPTTFVPTNETFTVTLGVGAPFGSGNEWRVGFAGKKFWEAFPVTDLDTNSVTIDRPETYAFDFGATAVFRGSWGDWHLAPALGAALVNAGSDITSDLTNQSDPLPTRMHFGGSVVITSPSVWIIGAQVPLISISCNIDGDQRLHGQPFTWGMGTEFSMSDILFLRSGFINDPGDEHYLDSSAWGIGLGIPANSFQLRFDYAHTSNVYQPDNYGVALSWQL